MKKFILLTILVGMFLTSCSANSNAEKQTLSTVTTEALNVETVPESTAEESKITTVTTVSETTKISQLFRKQRKRKKHHRIMTLKAYRIKLQV